ncbi:MAG: glycosyltransferase family 4 protein [Armatimonadota bacterium]|nr:glycosyltransferase family 4 protein [bacterium]
MMTADTVGGVWTYSVELARALENLDVDVVLATMGAPLRPEQREEVKGLRRVIVYESNYKLEWMEDPWDEVHAAGEWLLRVEKSTQPDVVHLNGYAHGAFPWHAPVLIVGHSCVLSWWRAVKGEDAPQEWDSYRKEVSNGLASVPLVLAPTHAMLASLDHHYGPFQHSAVIANGREPSGFRNQGKEPFIFTAGRVWDEAKNIAALEKAAPALKWPLYVAGEEEHPDGGTSEHSGATFLGRLAPQVMPYWYSRAGIYALPARYEPFGLSVLEAALSECALVLGDIDSLREVWGDTALFVPPDDTDALAHTINLLADDPAKRATLAARARTRALLYGSRRMADAYLSAYSYLLGNEAALDQLIPPRLVGEHML